MAVTQQLARIGCQRMELCRVDVDALEKLLSFKSEPRDSHVDLDSAPKGLETAIEKLLDLNILDIIKRLCSSESPFLVSNAFNFGSEASDGT